MANLLSKEANLKFTYQDFRCMYAPDLFINIWTYNYLTDHFPCIACETTLIIAKIFQKKSGAKNGVILKLWWKK